MKKRPNRWLFFSGLAFQIGIVMYLCIWLGDYLDGPSGKHHYTLLLSIFGMIAIIWIIISQSKRFRDGP
ncbi:AtpZ/AtpI family protein [Flavobacteriaceae bacterium]|jgi:hypothetical protein|nr:AtpZ/AtpI family protein [Flavobacteriaceae bacterium]MDA7710471.1 AtpZ/AtpI family protein [Flavobacteriaceae bacterium]MDA8900040.1 AtpZ/AtpI family protein [Flavobacteriaceae bacterium]